jgi:hypothetical protein
MCRKVFVFEVQHRQIDQSRDGKNLLFFHFYFHLYSINLQIKEENFRLLENGKFRILFKSDPVNFCALMSNKGKSSPLFKIAIDSARAVAPEVFHPCPYEGEFSLKNITALRHVITFLPSVTFKVKVEMTDGENFLFGLDLVNTLW